MKITATSTNCNQNQQISVVKKNQSSFKSALCIDANPCVTEQISKLPEITKKGISLFSRILGKNNKPNAQVRIFCADDICGYSTTPNYWGMEIKSKNEERFGYPPAIIGDKFDFHKGKTTKQVARELLEAYKQLDVKP